MCLLSIQYNMVTYKWYSSSLVVCHPPQIPTACIIGVIYDNSRHQELIEYRFPFPISHAILIILLSFLQNIWFGWHTMTSFCITQFSIVINCLRTRRLRWRSVKAVNYVKCTVQRSVYLLSDVIDKKQLLTTWLSNHTNIYLIVRALRLGIHGYTLYLLNL